MCHPRCPGTEVLSYNLSGQTKSCVCIFLKETQNLVISTPAKGGVGFDRDLRTQRFRAIAWKALWEHQATTCCEWGSAAQWEPPEPHIPQSVPNVNFSSRFSSLNVFIWQNWDTKTQHKVAAVLTGRHRILLYKGPDWERERERERERGRERLRLLTTGMDSMFLLARELYSAL